MEGTIVWADRATVFELHPPSRTCARWLLLRAFRCGNTYARIQLKLEGWRWRSIVNIARDACKIAYGLSAALVAGSKQGCVRQLLHASGGLGMLYGYLGGTYCEYK
jgi:hypothetical protein